MKIIHTGDWHIGKLVNEFSMVEDQRYILDRLLELLEVEKPQALVIAGDLYDRSVPPIEAVELLDETFSKILLEMNIPILLIAGNHDGAERISFGSRILTKKGLHIAGVFDGSISKTTIEDEFGKVNFYLLPYIDPRKVRLILNDDAISNHDIAMEKLIGKIKSEMNYSERNILVTHGYITSLGQASEELSESERPLSIGGTDIVKAEHFSCFDFTALGHLHGPQKVGTENIRYSGSLLKYSFSETNHKKGICIIELKEKGNLDIAHKQLIPRRDMRIIKGPLKELLSEEVYSGSNNEDYVYAVLTDEGELVDPISKLRAVYPNIMGLSKESSVSKEKSRTSASEGYKTKSKLELFDEFYLSINGNSLSKEGFEIISEIVEAVEKSGL